MPIAVRTRFNKIRGSRMMSVETACMLPSATRTELFSDDAEREPKYGSRAATLSTVRVMTLAQYRRERKRSSQSQTDDVPQTKD